MVIHSSISPQVLAAATTLLQPYAPELSPRSLVEAIKSFSPADTGKNSRCGKPLTRQETAELLSVSLPTVNKYIRDGKIRAHKVGSPLVRIDPASVRALLESNEINSSK